MYIKEKQTKLLVRMESTKKTFDEKQNRQKYWAYKGVRICPVTPAVIHEFLRHFGIPIDARDLADSTTVNPEAMFIYTRMLQTLESMELEKQLLDEERKI